MALHDTDAPPAVHERWARLNGEFLEYVESDPACLERAAFEGLDRLGSAVYGSVQAWPTFVASATMRRIERVTVDLCGLIKRLVQERFAGNAGAISEFYGIPAARAVQLAEDLRIPWAMDGVVARGDFVEAADGLRCVEFNMTSHLGGWQTSFFAELYRRIPRIERFLGCRRISSRHTVRSLFRHVLERSLRQREDEVHLVFAAPPEARAPETFFQLNQRIYQGVLSELAPGARGRIFNCLPTDLEVQGGQVWLGQHPVSAVIDYFDGWLPAPVEEAWRNGRVDLYNGPLTAVLRDKRNLALLSEEATASGLFEAAERQMIADCVPWTRQLLPGTLELAGSRGPAFQLVTAERERLVLKPGRRSGGLDVHVGRFTGAEDWRRLVERGLRERSWVVQAYSDPAPRLFQYEEGGCVPHDVVWGLFAFGTRPGGGFLRLAPRDRHSGVINSATGAVSGILFEVDEGDEAGEAEGPTAERPQEMRFDAATKALHSRLSGTARRFLEYVEERPEMCERSRFDVLDSDPMRVTYRLQAWPAFLDRTALGRCSEAAVGLARLIKTVPGRVFGSDVERLAEFYELDAATGRLLAQLLANEEHLRPLLARGDFIDTEDGFSCIEINLASNLGGWASGLWERLYRQARPLSDFLESEGLEVATVDPLDAFFAHSREVSAAAGWDADGELNVVLAVPPGNQAPQALQSYARDRYQDFLRRCGGLEGSLRVCAYDDLDVVEDRRVTLDGRRIHVLVESYGGVVPQRLFLPWMAGGIVILNGPVSRILNDRRTLALLSEYGDSRLFSEADRELVRRHVPWTRMVVDDFVTFRGRRAPLPDVLVDEREAMILKHVASTRGEKVVVGAKTSPESWRRLVAGALSDGRWIAQERVESLPYAFQSGAAGWAPQELVWGFFVFGESYGGGFLRMMPQGGPGVVNAARGAEEAVLFVVNEAPEPGVARHE